MEKKKDARSVFKIVLFTLVCIGINLAGRRISSLLYVPLWLDTVGTMAAAAYLGMIPSILTAALTSVLISISHPIDMVYGLVSISIAVVTSLFCKKRMFGSLGRAAFCGFCLSLLSVAISVPLNYFLYRGYSQNPWGDITVDMLKWNGVPLFIACIAGELAVDFLDKQFCVFLIFIFNSILKFIQKKNAAKKAAGIVASLIILSTGLAFPIKTDAESNIKSTVYDRTNGLMSSEANAIAETNDGMIWIGSYAGLSRYDGKDFEFVTEGSIANVNTLYTDSEGRLWIGTNDGGVSVYEKGKYYNFSRADGLPSDSIRCFLEMKDGSMIVATSMEMAVIDKNEEIKTLENGLNYVNSITCYNGRILCSDNAGSLFELSEDLTEVKEITPASEEVNFIYCCGNEIYAGTGDGKVIEVFVDDKGNASFRTILNLEKGEINSIMQDSAGRLWIASRGGLGFVENGIYNEESTEEFSTSFSSIHEDYQGNIWAASGDCGVIKLSKSPFDNITGDTYRYVTNAVASYDNRLYCGTDSGLFILDASGHPVTNELTETISGNRVRCIKKDGSDRLWIATYSGGLGLILSDGNSVIKNYTVDNAGATSDRFRCMLEMSDGTMAAGTADGINFIKNGSIKYTLTDEDGLENTQILTLAENDKGECLAGTDGAGIYIISDGKITGHFGKDEGLGSDIILRVIPYDGGFFAVTSNSIAYVKDDSVNVLNNFPYFNNFDISINGGTATILSSSGIYILPAADLAANKENMSYKFFGIQAGLTYPITSNSFCFNDGRKLVFCTNTGVMSLDCEYQTVHDVKFGISDIYIDDEKLEPSGDGSYRIPADCSEIKIIPSVRNYSQEEVYVRVNLKGITENRSVNYSDIFPLTYNSPASGVYTVLMEITDETGNNVYAFKEYRLEKLQHPWEDRSYIAYIIFISVWIVAYSTWALFALINYFRRKDKLEKMKEELEAKVDEQTALIRKKEEETEKLLVETIGALTNTIDAKDTYTSGHSRRVAEYSMIIADKLGYSEEDKELVYRAGLLHDVGKIKVPERVINKPGKLTAEEYEMMKVHPLAGFRIISGMSWDKKISLGARFHHERFDGKGYPDGREGENIPEIGRIIAVADAYDAMTSNRSYRDALPQAEVRQQIEDGKGKQFDPVMADIMLEVIDKDKEYKLRQHAKRNYRILVVDDDNISVMRVRKVTEKIKGCNLVAATDGKTALDIISKGHYDLILMDIYLPDGSGLDWMDKIHEKCSTPFICMSGEQDLEIFDRAIKAGAVDFLIKPFMPYELEMMITDLLPMG